MEMRQGARCLSGVFAELVVNEWCLMETVLYKFSNREFGFKNVTR